MDDLTRIIRATRKRAESEEAWRTAIRTAHENGLSLRRIGMAANVAHTRVLQIVRGK